MPLHWLIGLSLSFGALHRFIDSIKLIHSSGVSRKSYISIVASSPRNQTNIGHRILAASELALLFVRSEVAKKTNLQQVPELLEPIIGARCRSLHELPMLQIHILYDYE